MVRLNKLGEDLAHGLGPVRDQLFHQRGHDPIVLLRHPGSSVPGSSEKPGCRPLGKRLPM
jgi:hypothetical protein